MGHGKKVALDELLVRRGLAEDLAEARALVMSGRVVVGDQRVDKPGTRVADGLPVRVKGGDDGFVSRGGAKLAAALTDLGLAESLEGSVVLDIGASTGGFTGVCLARGARLVLALDVGTAQLAWELRQDPRVVVLERQDIRAFEPAAHPAVDFVVADVSFNSLARLAPAIRAAAPGATGFLLLVKPQFELPRDEIPDGGVVTDPAARDRAVGLVRDAFAGLGLREARSVPSRVEGRTGNREIFLYLRPG